MYSYACLSSGLSVQILFLICLNAMVNHLPVGETCPFRDPTAEKVGKEKESICAVPSEKIMIFHILFRVWLSGLVILFKTFILNFLKNASNS